MKTKECEQRLYSVKDFWDLHQGLWTMLGCRMKKIKEDTTTLIYKDLNSKKNVKGMCYKYTYTSKGKDLSRGLIQPLTIGVTTSD